MGTTKNLIDQKGIDKLKKLVEDARICHFVSALNHKPLTSRPMSTLEVDEAGNIWFFSAKSSKKNSDIQNYPEVQLFYTSTAHSEYLSVFGKAKIVNDKDKIESLWTPIAKVWFHEGVEDPEISLIKVTPSEAHYWDTKHNKFVQLLKMAAGSLFGKSLDDGVEGRIKI